MCDSCTGGKTIVTRYVNGRQEDFKKVGVDLWRNLKDDMIYKTENNGVVKNIVVQDRYEFVPGPPPVKEQIQPT